jgi:hypothetical protein
VHHAVARTARRPGDAEALGGHLRQPPRICSHAFLTRAPLRSAPELAAVADVLGTLSVRVGARRTRVSGTPRVVAATWSILVCSPWPHLGAAVVDQHGPVLVDVDERAGLVEGREVERDAELDRGDRQAPLDVLVRVVERRDLLLPRGEVAASRVCCQIDASRSGWRTGLAVGRGLPRG